MAMGEEEEESFITDHKKKRKRKAVSTIIPGIFLSCSRPRSDAGRAIVKSEDVKTFSADLARRANSNSKKQDKKLLSLRDTESSLPSSSSARKAKQQVENLQKKKQRKVELVKAIERNDFSETNHLHVHTVKKVEITDGGDPSSRSHPRSGCVYAKDSIWQSRLNNLRDYKKQHGDCLVPYRYKGHGRLGLWVSTQRQLYKNSMLRKDRKEALEAEGFVWYMVKHTSFELRLLEFIAYREIYGTRSVPQNFPNYQEFGNWAHTTRKEYIKFRDGKPTQLTFERFEALDAEGFIWVEEKHLPWRERFQELDEFRKVFGHCNVPYDYICKALVRWISYQRAEYWKLYSGERTVMTQQKIKELDNIGFVWCLRPPKIK